MQALFFASRFDGVSSFGTAFFREIVGDAARAAFLFFFAVDFVVSLVIEVLSWLLRFFFAGDWGASGEVDMSRPGSWTSSSIATWESLLLRLLLLLSVPVEVFAGLGIDAPFASGLAEVLWTFSSLVGVSFQTHHCIHIPIAAAPALDVPVDWIVLINHVDGFAFD